MVAKDHRDFALFVDEEWLGEAHSPDAQSHMHNYLKEATAQLRHLEESVVKADSAVPDCLPEDVTATDYRTMLRLTFITLKQHIVEQLVASPFSFFASRFTLASQRPTVAAIKELDLVSLSSPIDQFGRPR